MTQSSLEAGLIGWWPFHEQSGSATDLSGYGNTGSLVNGVTQGVSGKGGLTAYSFAQGSGTYIDIGTLPLTATSDFTVSCWVYPTDTTVNDQRIIDLREDIRFIIAIDRTGNGELSLWVDGSNHYLTDIPENEWVHVTVTYDNSQRAFTSYLNGEQDGTATDNVTGGSQESNVWSGNANGPGGNTAINGLLCDCRIYDRILSPAEITALSQVGGQAVPPTDGVSRYAFEDDSSSSTAVDVWGSNDGTIQNGASYTSSPHGTALSFDGTDDYVDIGDVMFDGWSEFAVSAWVKPNALSGAVPSGHDGSNDYVIHKSGSSDDNFGLQIGKSAVAAYIDASGNYTVHAYGDVEIGSWHHLTVNYTGSTLQLYVDGVLAGETSVSGSLVSNTNSVEIGARTGQSLYLDGLIDDVRIYDRALRDWEIKSVSRGEYELVHPPSNGTAYYPLDGDATEPWNGHDGTTSGGVSWVPGVRGQAVSLDGTDDYITSSSFPNDGGAISWTTWVKFDGKGYSEYKSILRNCGGPSNVQQRTDDVIQWYVSNGSSSVSLDILPPADYNIGQWYHLAGTYANGQVRGYVNGHLAATASLSGSMTSTTNDFYIGMSEANSEHFPGDIDDVRIYERELTQWEIAQTYRYGTRGADLRARTVIQ